MRETRLAGQQQQVCDMEAIYICMYEVGRRHGPCSA
jgi:hypothetical protein